MSALGYDLANLGLIPVLAREDRALSAIAEHSSAHCGFNGKIEFLE